MKTTLSRGSQVQQHPNKYVQLHEQFLVNKALEARVKNVKSTIQTSNKKFMKKIESRRKPFLPSLHEYVRSNYPPIRPDESSEKRSAFNSPESQGEIGTFEAAKAMGESRFRIQPNKGFNSTLMHPQRAALMTSHVQGSEIGSNYEVEVNYDPRPFTTNDREAQVKTPAIKGPKFAKHPPVFYNGDAGSTNALFIVGEYQPIPIKPIGKTPRVEIEEAKKQGKNMKWKSPGLQKSGGNHSSAKQLSIYFAHEERKEESENGMQEEPTRFNTSKTMKGAILNRPILPSRDVIEEIKGPSLKGFESKKQTGENRYGSVKNKNNRINSKEGKNWNPGKLFEASSSKNGKLLVPLQKKESNQQSEEYSKQNEIKLLTGSRVDASSNHRQSMAVERYKEVDVEIIGSERNNNKDPLNDSDMLVFREGNEDFNNE